MSLLDPSTISDADDYTAQDFRSRGLVVRRCKNDSREPVRNDFQECFAEQCASENDAVHAAAAAAANASDDANEDGDRLPRLFAASASTGSAAKPGTDFIREGISLFGRVEDEGESVGRNYAFA
ncbi:hypothetical protein JZU54_04350, partial [bacterium]|nr:hypothetical protein [bacterium]